MMMVVPLFAGAEIAGTATDSPTKSECFFFSNLLLNPINYRSSSVNALSEIEYHICKCSMHGIVVVGLHYSLSITA